MTRQLSCEQWLLLGKCPPNELTLPGLDSLSIQHSLPLRPNNCGSRASEQRSHNWLINTKILSFPSASLDGVSWALLMQELVSAHLPCVQHRLTLTANGVRSTNQGTKGATHDSARLRWDSNQRLRLRVGYSGLGHPVLRWHSRLAVTCPNESTRSAIHRLASEF